MVLGSWLPRPWGGSQSSSSTKGECGAGLGIEEGPARPAASSPSALPTPRHWACRVVAITCQQRGPCSQGPSSQGSCFFKAPGRNGGGRGRAASQCWGLGNTSSMEGTDWLSWNVPAVQPGAGSPPDPPVAAQKLRVRGLLCSEAHAAVHRGQGLRGLAQSYKKIEPRPGEAQTQPRWLLPTWEGPLPITGVPRLKLAGWPESRPCQAPTSEDTDTATPPHGPTPAFCLQMEGARKRVCSPCPPDAPGVHCPEETSGPESDLSSFQPTGYLGSKIISMLSLCGEEKHPRSQSPPSVTAKESFLAEASGEQLQLGRVRDWRPCSAPSPLHPGHRCDAR